MENPVQIPKPLWSKKNYGAGSIENNNNSNILLPIHNRYWSILHKPQILQKLEYEIYPPYLLDISPITCFAIYSFEKNKTFEKL